MGPGHSKCTEHLPIWYFVVTWLSNSWLKPQCAASVLFDHFLIVFLCRSQSTWAITDWGHFGHMTQYFLNVPTIFPHCTEPESASYIVWHILKELNLFLPRKVLVHWTWNYNVFNKYWVSKQGSVMNWHFSRSFHFYFITLTLVIFQVSYLIKQPQSFKPFRLLTLFTDQSKRAVLKPIS